ncbi:MAG: ribosomal protein S18-alanine N-acetyltransferase [Microcoleaceae cyanobacterium]
MIILKIFVAVITLQPLTEELLNAAAGLDKLCLGQLWTLEGYRRELDSPNSDLLVWIQPPYSSSQAPLLSVKASQVQPSAHSPSLIGLGCSWAIVDEAHITVLAIHPDYQGLGLGKGLLWGLLYKSWQRQLKWATLEVRPSNQVALSLYQKFGFTEAGRRRRYYPDNNEDALILWRGGLQYPQFEQELARWKQQINSV